MSEAAEIARWPPTCICVAVCCSVLQCVAVCCSVLQCVAVEDVVCDTVCDAMIFGVCCSVLHLGPVPEEHPCATTDDARTTRHISLSLQRVAVCCNVLQCVAVYCSVLQCVAVCCSVLQCQRL